MEVKLREAATASGFFSKYLKDAGYVKEKCYELWTKAGPVQVEFLDEDASHMKVDMGYAAFGADSIHAVGFEGDMINESVFFCDNFYNITCVSMGNPNCVVMMEEISRKKALHLGPYVENSKYFPDRINMQLCHVVDREISRLKSMSGSRVHICVRYRSLRSGICGT